MKSWANRSPVSGVCSASFMTTVQPVASAGPSFQAAIRSGKFQGMIWATTPTGSRDRVREKKSWPAESGMVEPMVLVAQPAM